MSYKLHSNVLSLAIGIGVFPPSSTNVVDQLYFVNHTQKSRVQFVIFSHGADNRELIESMVLSPDRLLLEPARDYHPKAGCELRGVCSYSRRMVYGIGTQRPSGIAGNYM